MAAFGSGGAIPDVVATPFSYYAIKQETREALLMMAWWKKMLLTFGLFAIWFCGLIFVGGYGYASQYFWSSGSALAIGFSVAPFWRLRYSSWYWPTIAGLTLIHLAALYLQGTFIAHPELPPKGVVVGMLLIDCMASWSIIVAACWMTTRRFPWQLSDQ